MIIDTHTHIFPDALAARAIGKLSATSMLTPSTDGTVADLKRKLRENGIDGAVCLSIATKAGQDAKVNDFAISVNGGELISFGSVHPYSDNCLEELERLKAKGIKGVKLHPEYQRFEVRDARADRVYDKIAELGLIAVFHCGFDIAFPDSDNASPTAMAAVIDRHPDMKVVCAHMGGMLRWGEVLDALAGRDCWLDTAMCAGYLDRELCARIIDKHGADRILFATDTPWNNWRDTIDYVESLGLSAADKEKIYYGNAARLLSL